MSELEDGDADESGDVLPTLSSRERSCSLPNWKKESGRRHSINPFLLPVYQPPEAQEITKETEKKDRPQEKEGRRFKKIAQGIALQYKWTKNFRSDPVENTTETSNEKDHPEADERPTFDVGGEFLGF